MNYLEYIDSYFQGALLPEERPLFEKKLQEDPDFADEVAFYLSADKVLSEKLEQEKKAKFKELYKQQPAQQPVVRSMKKVWRYAAAAAVAGILVTSVLLLRQPAGVQLADSYIDDNLQTLGVVLGSSPDSIQQGLRLYNEGKLAAAGTLFEEIARRDTANFTAKKYAGITYLRLNDYDKALLYFQQLETYTSLRANPAGLYQALTYMKRNAPGDKEKAGKLLREIVEQGREGKETAAQWLDEL